MTTSTKRRRERGAERLEREVGAYLAFYAELYPLPMLAAYPARERTGAAVARRVSRYGCHPSR